MNVAALIGHGPLLLDFDGPICSIFAGLPAPEVARHLVGMLRAEGVAVPTSVAGETDPLEVLRWTGAHCLKDVAILIEDELCAAEVRAAATAAPTPYGHDVIMAASRAGMPSAIVSNNSEGAIRTYLSVHGLSSHLSIVIGRPHADPGRMKPHPEPIRRAAAALGSSPDLCVLVGDSLTDIEGGRAAGARVIGYANRPWKVDALVTADAVVTSMQAVYAALPAAEDR